MNASPYRLHRLVLMTGSAFLASIHPSGAASSQAGDATAPALCSLETVDTCTAGGVVLFAPAYFTQFNPITALDMVSRVPGFSIDGGGNVRGFGGAGSNVLIDGQRPSTKSASIFDLLQRIGAGGVERIELIRGGAGGLDVGGQAVVVNVIRKAGAEGRATAPWELGLQQRTPGGLRPFGEISYTDTLAGATYTLGGSFSGVDLRTETDEFIERFFDDDEQRLRDGSFRDLSGGVNFKIEKPFDNGDVVRFNIEADLRNSRSETDERRLLASGNEDLALFRLPSRRRSFEIGADYERGLTDDFGVKLIALFGRTFESAENGFEFLPQIGETDQSAFISEANRGERIGRIEFDWSGWQGHTIQFGGEVASTFIDSAAQLLALDESGVLVEQPLVGANTRVGELRGEPFVNDSWALAKRWTLDAGFALELSRIAQTGDNANARFFVYPKPSATLTFRPRENRQIRLSVVRDVNQLNFGQFVSNVNFDDEDVDFGNPDLQPQRTWEIDAIVEQRFGEIGVVELRGFAMLINDVEDLLPLGGIFEVPGNIGNGEIYGVRLTSTLPLDRLGISKGRLDSSVTQRQSRVTDPVTGLNRSLSFREERFWNVDFRQDVPRWRSSWGFSVSNNRPEVGFGLDEINSFERQAQVNAFVETTALKGVKMRLSLIDPFNATNRRDRFVFDGARNVAPLLFRETRDSRDGGILIFSVSGAL